MVYDCFPFYDEFMLLDIRLAELGNVVDEFVLVESNITFSGKPKPLYFSEAMDTGRYGKWKDRIVPLISRCDAPDRDPFENEAAQRNALGDYLKAECKPDDLIILTDADEIARPQAVHCASALDVPGRLLMNMYYYWLNCLLCRAWPWAAFCRFRDFTTTFKGKCQGLRISTPPICDRIPYAGWHFSYLMPAEKIAEKLGAFAHTTYDRPKWRDVPRIEACRANCTDLFEREEHKYELTGLEELPAIIRNHPERYAAFIKKEKAEN